MAGNQAPIYSRVAAMGFTPNGAMGTATASSYGIVADYTGTGANNAVIFTADATNGGFVQRIRFKALGTNTTAAVARIYINNGGSQTVANNNYFYGECSLPTTVANTSYGTADVDYPLNFALPPGYKIVVGISSSASLGAGWTPLVLGGAY